MAQKISKKVIACILVLAFVLQSIPLMLFMVSGAGGQVDLLQTHLASSRGVRYFPGNGTVDYSSSQVTAAKISSWLDGNTVNGEDVNSGPTWNPPQWHGVEFTLDSVLQADRLTIYAGLAAYPDTYCVYASDSPDTLYSPDSLVDDNVSSCTGEARDVEIGRPVKYVAVLFNGEVDYHRPKEFQLWGEGGAESVKLENLFHREDGSNAIESSRGVRYFPGNGTVDYSSSQVTAAKISSWIDGDTVNGEDVNSGPTWNPPQWHGVEFALSGVFKADRLTIYAGLAAYPDTYCVYASDSLDTLYSPDSLVNDNVSGCTGGARDVEIGRSVKYVAVLFNGKDDYHRPKEFQLWCEVEGDEPVQTENLFRRPDGSNAIANSRGIAMNAASGYVQNKDSITNAIGALTDGNTAQHNDWPTATEWYYGAEYTLDASYPLDHLTIYSALDGLPDSYRVYASENAEDLYKAESVVADGIQAVFDRPVDVKIGKTAKYVAIIGLATSGNTRPKEFELYNEIKDEPVQTENLFRRPDGSNAIANSRGIAMNAASGHVQNKDSITNAIGALTDGNTTQHNDWPTSTEWYYGAEYTRDASYPLDHLTIYAALDGLPDSYRVYASEALEDLYKAESVVADGVQVTFDTPAEVEIGKTAKYIAIIGLATSGNTRPKEFELYGSVETTEPSDTENLFHKADGSNVIEASRGITMNIASGNVKDKATIDQTVIGGLIDGNLTDKYDLPTSNEWYYGVEFSLDGEYYADHLTIYAASDPADTYRVYASATLGTLYTADSLVADGVSVPANTATDVEIGRNIRYIAVLSTVTSGNARPTEFQLWGGEKKEQPDTGAKKVLTIGNSFSENASIYATEIARAQGYDLTFAYLKLSSGTIDQHWQNAQTNNGVYKFTYTDSAGRHNIKNEGAGGATIQEALEYMDWDIIVLQQGSTASHDYATYGNLGNLINYVQQFCPDAELMIHETWSWANWPAERFDDIEAAYHRAAKENGNLPIIHTGRAFEFAREALGSRTILNESDNQHANAYGQFVAGASYVTAIFGCDIRENTFGDGHPAFADIDMDVLRKAVMDAADYQPEEPDPGDEDFVAEWPEAPAGDNLFVGADATPIVAPGGDFSQGKYYNYSFMDGSNKADLSALADGDVTKHYDAYGFGDNSDLPGVLYDLGVYYDVSHIRGWAGIYNASAYCINGYRVYASELREDLFKEESLVFSYSNDKDVSSMFAYEPDEALGKIRYIAIFLTDSRDGGWRLREFAAYGTKSADQTGPSEPEVPDKPDTYYKEWPEAPSGDNLFAGAQASTILAPGGDFLAAKEQAYPFMNGSTPAGLSVLIDGDLTLHYDAYGFGSNDKPGILYDLGGYYDLSHIRGWAGIYNSENYRVYGYRVYASDNLADLYKTGSLVFEYSDQKDLSSMFAADVSLERVRYVAIFLTDSQDGGWRLREFAAYGTKSADQTQPQIPSSIIEGLDAEYYGVATDDLTDPVYAGASAEVGALTDGKRDNVEFWGGKDTENSKFVFIYDLYANYDLTGAAVYAFADMMDTEFGVHKGIRSATIYASRTFDSLFAESNGVVVKADYAVPGAADETSFYEADALPSWKMARYVAFVFTIDDSAYGACRLEELQVYGTLSATQDEEPEEERLPQYLDISGDNGVILRLFQKNGRDDLTALGAKLVVTLSEDKADLDPVAQKLGGRFTASKLYTVKLVDASGKEIPLDGRIVRLSFPAEDSSIEWKIACVDDSSAELISSSRLGDAYTVETETLRAYATVKASSGAAGDGSEPGGDEPAAAAAVLPTVLWAVAIVLGVLAAGGVVLTVVAAVKRKKEE